MSKINIANYIIGELAAEKTIRLDAAERITLIDNLIDRWSRKEYFQPDFPENGII
jgi:hypothetical protein